MLRSRRSWATVATTITLLANVSAMAIIPSEGRSNGVIIPLAKHSSFLNADGTADFDALNAHAEYIVAKVARGPNDYERNTRANHHASTSGSATQQPATSIPLTPYQRSFWYGSITVGTPPISFLVQIDTGSASFFLPSVACDDTCEGHTRWDPKSKTAHLLEGECKMEYGDGSIVKGDKYTDNVTIAGLTAKTQTFCAATTYSPHFDIKKFPADGLMGMAFRSASGYGAASVFETLVSEGAVVNQVFSWNISATGGELYIGGANRDLYKDEFVYTSVTEQHYWRVNVENIQGKGETILENIDAIIDTGCTLIIGDETRIKRLHDTLGGEHYTQGWFTYPCDSFPDSVKFTFNGKSFLVSPSSHNFGPVKTGSPDCLSGIVYRKASDSRTFWSVGNVFLRNVYTSFDYRNKKVGFAEHAEWHA